MKTLLFLLFIFTSSAFFIKWTTVEVQQPKCPITKPKELTYTEQVEKSQLDIINANIDKNKRLSKKDKKGLKIFVKCVRELVPNINTVSNLIPWQNKALIAIAEQSCDVIARNKIGSK